MSMFQVSFPDRKDKQSIITEGTSKQAVWDRYHREYPFENIVVLPYLWVLEMMFNAAKNIE